MRIKDIDPNWTSEELIEEMMKEANEIDLILYLSGLDDDALKRVDERNKCLDILEEIKKYHCEGVRRDYEKSNFNGLCGFRGI